MKKIKVCLRIGKRPHPIYYDLINFPPKDIIFKYPQIMHVSSKKKAGFFHTLKLKIWFRYLKKNPPAVRINSSNSDLIHSTNNIMILNKKPWVMDIENLWGLIGFNPKNLEKKYFSKVKKILSSKHCKVLMPYTLAAKNSLLNAGCENLKSKTQVVYPTKKARKDFKKQKNKIPKVLWAGSKFLEKGGNTALQVFDFLDKKIEFEMLMLGPVPGPLKKKYKNHKNISFVENKRHDKVLWKSFEEADIFLYPTNLDSFGLAMIDAMNYKIPIIVSDMFSAPEIVEDGKTGFVITHPLKWHDENFQMKYDSFEEYIDKLKDFKDEKFISNLAKKLQILIENERLRKKMGEAGYLELKQGKFSIKKRNESLEKIYLEAIKK